MAFGLGVLGHSHATLWAMTPRELDAAARGRFGRHVVLPLARREFDMLATRFPDCHEE